MSHPNRFISVTDEPSQQLLKRNLSLRVSQSAVVVCCQLHFQLYKNTKEHHDKLTLSTSLMTEKTQPTDVDADRSTKIETSSLEHRPSTSSSISLLTRRTKHLSLKMHRHGDKQTSSAAAAGSADQKIDESDCKIS
jgi:hypothetical protein